MTHLNILCCPWKTVFNDLWSKMSEAEKNVDGCVFCEIGQNKVPETELLYDDVDYAVFR